MKKIPSLFVRDYELVATYDGAKAAFLATEQVTPGCEWVINGEGTATRKWDGACCKIEDGVLYKRYDAKHGKTPPEGFVPAQDPDPITGHWPGWLVVNKNKPEDKWIWKAYVDTKQKEELPDGTYEAIGPKINGNRDGASRHMLLRHGFIELYPTDRSFEGLRLFLSETYVEGIVFHHPDGRMCKIKRSDFGLKW